MNGEEMRCIPVTPRLALLVLLAKPFEERQHKSVTNAIGHHFDLLREQAVIRIFQRGEQRRLGEFGLEVLEDVVRLVDGWPAIIEDEHGELLERIVLRCLRGMVPWDFGL